MPPFLSTSKAVGSVISRRNVINQFVGHAKNGGRTGNFDLIRWVTSISVIQMPSVHPAVVTAKKAAFYLKFTRKGSSWAVDLYHGFVPWCQRSDVIKHYPDGSFDAELEIGFKFLVESYVSHVELSRPKFVKSTASESSLFDHLINIWEFNPGPVPGTCSLYFLVDFKFQSPLYRQPLE
ncbi:hypothetical protein GOBAR_AA32278 [Gossypium barbadense]|uniref:Coenzyme Q-binding protein COQ10 START domain-containing protein n=1 Tax=Gossypium barbadense TaxID=3634 RepID=A0A2P5WBF0_GOSBA|nr:hypothetical protein GOBAR_AA32278 [Gossypium barbadense]